MDEAETTLDLLKNAAAGGDEEAVIFLRMYAPWMQQRRQVSASGSTTRPRTS